MKLHFKTKDSDFNSGTGINELTVPECELLKLWGGVGFEIQ